MTQLLFLLFVAWVAVAWLLTLSLAYACVRKSRQVEQLRQSERRQWIAAYLWWFNHGGNS